MGKEDVRSVKLRITDIIAGEFMVSRKLGEGGCGVIFEVFDLSKPTDTAACKAELSGRNTEDEILKLEGRVMKQLNVAGAKHVPILLKEGTERNYNYLIMSLLGPSLSDLRKQAPDNKFTLFTCMAVTIQAIDAIKEVHDIGYVHRDIKPSNFTIGLMGSSGERLIYLVDFGLARSFLHVKNGITQLRKKRKTVPFRGTVRYCSLNVHSQEEQGRHDDLLSLIYMLMEMYLGNLPWTNFDREKTERCKSETEQELLAKCPKEIETIVNHLKCLNYGLTPNYGQIRALICRIIVRNCEAGGRKCRLDWERGGNLENILRKRSLLHTRVGSCKGPGLTDILELSRVSELKLNADAIPLLRPTKEHPHTMTHSSIDDTIESPPREKEEPLAPRPATSCPTSGKYSYLRGKGRI